MPNYQNGKIYSIRSHLKPNSVYIGSTTQSLAKRIADHKRNYKAYLKGNGHYITSFKLIKHPDCYIELIEDYECNSKRELERREGELIRSINCVNKVIPGRTNAEYYEDNKEAIAARMKQYNQKNKVKKKQYDKQYHQNNKEAIAARKTEYRQNNKETIRAKKNQKFNCECGGKFTHANKARHFKSKKHQKYLSEQ